MGSTYVEASLFIRHSSPSVWVTGGIVIRMRVSRVSTRRSVLGETLCPPPLLRANTRPIMVRLTAPAPVWLTPNGVKPSWAKGLRARTAEEAHQLCRDSFVGPAFDPEDDSVFQIPGEGLASRVVMIEQLCSSQQCHTLCLGHDQGRVISASPRSESIPCLLRLLGDSRRWYDLPRRVVVCIIPAHAQ